MNQKHKVETLIVFHCVGLIHDINVTIDILSGRDLNLMLCGIRCFMESPQLQSG